jgi:capsular polysaccharide export protein
VAARHADVVTAEGDVVDLIEWADRVETLSSLTGFEALLRGKEVVAHGLPFYAGWGLTSDLTPAPRRRRRRRLDELIAVVLTRYCRHVDPRTLEPLTAEELIGRLAGRKTSLSARAFAGTATSLSWLGRKLGL